MEESPETPGFRRPPSGGSKEDATHVTAKHAGGTGTRGRTVWEVPAGGAEWEGQREGGKE